jgi:carboxymethylenebutenolidase
MGEMIRFERPDGKHCEAYLALPSEGADAPGFVVLQEWWGLNEQIKKTADRLAAEGYRALVPDLFRGKITTKQDEASHLMSSLNFLDASEQDTRGAVQHLKQYKNTKVAVGGFCMGGALTLISAVKVPELDAALVFYGIPPKQVADRTRIKVPLSCHFAQHDDWCTPSAVDELESDLKGGKVAYELFRYDAQHAFMNEARPEVFDAECAKLGWERMLAFLKRTVG